MDSVRGVERLKPPKEELEKMLEAVSVPRELPNESKRRDRNRMGEGVGEHFPEWNVGTCFFQWQRVQMERSD